MKRTALDAFDRMEETGRKRARWVKTLKRVSKRAAREATPKRNGWAR